MTSATTATREFAAWRRAALGLGLALIVVAGLVIVGQFGGERIRAPAAAVQPLLLALLVVLALGLLVAMSQLVRSLRRSLAQQVARAARVAADEQRLREMFDAMEVGVVRYDADGRLVYCNRQFRALYAPIADRLQPGIRFAELLEAAASAGLVPDAAQDPATWIRERLALHERPGRPIVRRMADGRWRRIAEQRLPDGGVLSFSFDVTERIEKEQELAQARAEAQAATQRLHDAIEALPAGFELYDAEDRLVLCNRVLREMYPRIADLMLQRQTFEALVRANHAAGGMRPPGPFEPWLAQRIADRRREHPPVVHRLEDGRWVRSHERCTRDGWLVGVRLDVTEIVQQQARAEAATRQLQEAIEALPDGFALYDADDRLVVFNRRYREIYAHTAPAIRVGATFESLLRYGLEHGQYADAIGREPAWLAERLHRHRNPGPPELQQLPGNRWLRIDERTTVDGGIAGVRTDVTELVVREQELKRLNAQLDEAIAQLTRLSDTDSLTGVANRRQFDRRLAEEWARAARRGAPLSLLLVDVDHFKRFNDAHGHLLGDECLHRVAQALHGCARRAADLVARIGGEEFAVLLPDADAAQARALAQHCLDEVEALAIVHGNSPVGHHITLSIGVATCVPAITDGPASLLQRADRALYAAKQAGRNRAALAAAG